MAAYTFLAFAGLSLLWSLWAMQLRERHTHEALAVSEEHGDDSVSIEAWTNGGRFTPGKKLTFTIVVQNNSGKTMSGLEFVSFDADGFVIPTTDHCWSNGRPVCVEYSGTPTTNRLPRDLPSGEVATVTAAVDAAGEPGKYAIRGVVGWFDGAIPRRKPIHLAPLIIESRVLSLVNVTRQFLKDLGLPIVLAIVGFIFKQADNERTELQQALDKMLPISHTRMEEYWLPMCGTAGMIQANYQDHKKRRRIEDEEECLFNLVLLWLHMAEAYRKLGGFHFQSAEGENVVGGAWDIVLKWSHEVFTRERREGAMLEIGDRFLRFVEYKRRFFKRPVIRELRREFATELRRNRDRVEIVMATLDIFVLVLEHELNRPYRAWYGKLPAFDHAGLQGAVQRLQTARKMFGQPWLTPQLDGLLHEIRVYERFVRKSR